MAEPNIQTLMQSYLSLPRFKLYDTKIKSYIDNKIKQTADEEDKDVNAIVVALNAMADRIEKLESQNIELKEQVTILETKVIEAIELTEENAITANDVNEAFSK